MARMKKSDLGFKDYAWKAVGDNPKRKGKIEHTHLNRKQGYEVIYFVNTFLEKYYLTETATGRKIEEMIRKKVPPANKDRESIEKWIVENWG